MSSVKKWLVKHREIIRYLFWGVMTTVVSWASYSAVSWLIAPLSGDTVTVFIANSISWICAVLFAFFTNKVWVFGSRDWSRGVVLPELAKFISSRLATGVLEIAAVPLLVLCGLDQTIFGIEGMLAKVIVSFAVVILNYVFSKLFIFKQN